MASNPPYQVEDQTDEDFFDKLVEDDDGGPIKSRQDEGNDSDDAKAFANLTITDADAALDSADNLKTGFHNKGHEDLHKGLVAASSLPSAPEPSPAPSSATEPSSASPKAHAEESESSVPPSSFGCNTVTKTSSDDEIGSDSTMAIKRNGSSSSGVKEVGWNSFYADSMQNGAAGSASYSDFFGGLEDNSGDFNGETSGHVNEINSDSEHKSDNMNSSINYAQQYSEGQAYDASYQQTPDGQDVNSTQYWESLYPGWKFDANTGQWYQISGYNGTANAQGSYDSNSINDWNAASDGKAQVSYMQQISQPSVATVYETGPNLSQASQSNNSYPEHMFFDPQYPGWYYDTIAQEWRALESYNSPIQSTAQDYENEYASAGKSSQNDNRFYGDYGRTSNYGSQGFASQCLDSGWGGSYDNSHQQGLSMHATETAIRGETAGFDGNQKLGDSYGSYISVQKDGQNLSNSHGAVPQYNKTTQTHGMINETKFQSFVPGGNFSQQLNSSNFKHDKTKQYPNDYVGGGKHVNYSNEAFQSVNQISRFPQTGWSRDGRPLHALVTFGFGGKLIVMKDSTLTKSSCASQESGQCSISVLNLTEVIMGNGDASNIWSGSCGYFRSLCHQSFPGPLVGGNVGSKDLYKWIDERIASCESPDTDYKKGERVRLLFALLKIACQHYGKLRSPFGTDAILREYDNPESAVAKLFASAKKSSQLNEYGMNGQCLQNSPSEGQMLATASEVQNLLVSGRKMEALQCAQEGQLWGPALVLASKLGDQFYVETVKQMAIRYLAAGSPLRTLCLLVAGQPAEVFSVDNSGSRHLSVMNISQQTVQSGANSMLDNWEENLAVITANRTKDDELVIIHLGDCLWKDRSEVTAAHICYLVAEANFETYSDSARLCLIGADHWKFPRTFASPEAIQRTELYEYSKVLGNSQFMLLPFLPYKLIYAYMLAEVGKVSDSLKYCQAVLKTLKTGRAPEVETWKQLLSSLEERIKIHQQGGYSTNLAPAKFVGKLLNFFDSTAHKVVGGMPPPIPSSQGHVQVGDQHHQPNGAPRLVNSQSTTSTSSLYPSASMEPICEWSADNDRVKISSRSVSEPDFGRQETASQEAQGKMSVASGSSRFSRFGFGSQLLQKTVGLVLRPRTGNQAKLGDKNKFYYDEKLKRWVEEGAEPPAEEPALAPPPTTAAFQNASPEYNLKSALKMEGSPSEENPSVRDSTSLEHSSGIPPIPPSSNQFSSRGRMGVRARYVDTFNRSSGVSANKSFQSPPMQLVKPASVHSAKFFIPTPASANQNTVEATAESVQEDGASTLHTSPSVGNDPFQSPAHPSSNNIQRFPSLSTIESIEPTMNDVGAASAHSRRKSWSGSIGGSFSPPYTADMRSPGKPMRVASPNSFVTTLPSMQMPANGGSISEDLQEVEL